MIVREVTVGEKNYRIELQAAKSSPHDGEPRNSRAAQNSEWKITFGERELSVACLPLPNNILSLIVNGKSVQARVEQNGDRLRVFIDGRSYECSVRDPRSFQSRNRTAHADDAEQKVKASMPGKVVRLLAQPGDSIIPGQGLLVIEAMKMQNEVRSTKGGIVKSLAVREGTNVNAGDLLAVIE